MLFQNHSLTFIHRKKITSFSYQHSILLTHGLQHYCLLGQANLYHLRGLDKCQHSFGEFLWSKNDSEYLDVKLEVFKKDDNEEILLVPNITMRKPDFKQFIRLRNS